MAIRFDVGKFAECLQQLGKTALGNAMFLGSTEMMQHGPNSIFRCYGGFQGGYQGGMPMSFMHPYYSQGQTSPYLLQQGINQSTMEAMQLFDYYYEQTKKSQSLMYPQLQEETTTPTDPKQGAEITQAMLDKQDYNLMNEAWQKLNEKKNLTDNEKSQLGEAYKIGTIAAGKSWIAALDKAHGNSNEKLTVDEFTDFILTAKFGENPTAEQKTEAKTLAERAFERLDVDQDDNLTAEDAVSALYALDIDDKDEVDGKITKDNFATFKEALFAENGEKLSALLREGYTRLGDQAIED